MPNVIKYSTGATPTGCLRKGNMLIGNNTADYGLTFFNGIDPPSGGYTIYLNKASGGPSIYCPANDTQLIGVTNQIAGANYTTVAQCLNYFAGQSDKLCVNFNYEGIVTNGLVLNLDAGFDPSYPITGSTWYDISGNGFNGTLTNSPTFSSANSGSIVFDGVDDYVNLTTATTLGISNVSTSFTISTWFKVAVTGEYYLLDNYNGSTQDISFRIDSGKFEVYLMASAGGGFNAVQFGSGYNNGIWTNFTLIWNGSNTITAYANGINIGSSTQSGMTGNFDSGTAFQIGARPISSTYFPGNIATTQIYNRALLASEITQNYNAQKGRFGL
jgi:hypothetical protein